MKCAFCEHAADYHVDPSRISIMGESAGGNLALLTAYSMGDAQLPASTGVAPVAIRSVIDLYGPTEMAILYRTTSSPGFTQRGIAATKHEAFPLS